MVVEGLWRWAGGRKAITHLSLAPQPQAAGGSPTAWPRCHTKFCPGVWEVPAWLRSLEISSELSRSQIPSSCDKEHKKGSGLGAIPSPSVHAFGAAHQPTFTASRRACRAVASKVPSHHEVLSQSCAGCFRQQPGCGTPCRKA